MAESNGKTPITSADLREALDGFYLGLKAYIDERETRLEARLDERGTRLDARLDEREARLEARLDEHEARLDARLDERDIRILEKTQEFVRDAQTEILRAFHAFERSREVRFARLKTEVKNLDAEANTRIDQMEKRLMAVEEKLILYPPRPQ